MAKLLVNVRRKGRGFAGNSLRKIANKLCKTANRRTATNHSKVITRKIRPSVITLEVKKTGERKRRDRKPKKRREARSSCHVVKLYEFPRTKSSCYPVSSTSGCVFCEEFNNSFGNSDFYSFIFYRNIILNSSLIFFNFETIIHHIDMIF